MEPIVWVGFSNLKTQLLVVWLKPGLFGSMELHVRIATRKPCAKVPRPGNK